ncbi:MAG: ATP-dependent DNA ligase [Candidatus Korarchaeota archaeon]|nr:ATP-dependent DNA ligase [Candidatus Korarchaeota archaeon]
MGDILFIEVAKYYERIEATSGRLEMIDYLKKLFLETPPEILDKVVYLTLGSIAPAYEGVELGVGEKLLLKALSMATGISQDKLEAKYPELGDIGKLAEWAVENKVAQSFFTEDLTVNRVFETLRRVAEIAGEKAQDAKIRLLAGLFSDAKPLEARYIARVVTERLRLGVRDMTVLDALAEAFLKGRAFRDKLERKYNIFPDIGRIAKIVAARGFEGLEEIKLTLGIPVRPMLAQRLRSAQEIMDKIGPRVYAEFKYDGERMQIHVWKDGRVQIFSRRLENITEPYPDVREFVSRAVEGHDVVLDGETVAVNPDTGEILPFQELMHRRRKYGVEEAMKTYPTVTYVFDVLYLDGRELLDEPLEERRKILLDLLKENEKARVVQYEVVDNNVEELERFFEHAVEMGTEGLVVKDPKSQYQAGTRGWSWIKLKRSYISKMVEPVDLVVVGAFWGKGKRAGTYGALLMAAYSPEEDVFKTVCKMGSGFTDEELAELPKLLEPYKIEHRHPSVVSNLEADVWFVPQKVAQVLGDEITLSPTHTCGWGKVKRDAGLAIRFPRFMGWRDDKGPQDATTEEEIIQMYKMQLTIVTDVQESGTSLSNNSEK